MKQSDAPICITGMPASGLLLLGSMLAECGLVLPNEVRFTEQRASHPAALSTAVLEQLGGSWRRPPPLPGDQAWPALDMLLSPAESATLQQPDASIWGWIDPGAALVMPFWQRSFPELRVIICLRNPFEIAQALSKRHQLWINLILQLWFEYNMRLLVSIPPRQRIIVHYDTLWGFAADELRRICGLLGVAVAEGDHRRAATRIDHSQRHHEYDLDSWLELDMPLPILRLYMNMCAAAGPVYHIMVRDKALHQLRKGTAPGQSGRDHRPIETDIVQLMQRLHAEILDGRISHSSDE